MNGQEPESSELVSLRQLLGKSINEKEFYKYKYQQSADELAKLEKNRWIKAARKIERVLSPEPTPPSPRHLIDLIDRHRGRTIFVVGCSPQLNDVTPEEYRQIERYPSVALNLACMLFTPAYFLSAYLGHVTLALHYLKGKSTTKIWMTKDSSHAGKVAEALWVKRIRYNTDIGVPRITAGLVTRLNVALGASHLAYLLGAKRIVYVGVEQKNQLHFYNLQPKLELDIHENIRRLVSQPLYDNPEMEALAKRDLGLILEMFEDMTKLATTPFYEVDHTPTFREFFQVFASKKVEIISTLADNVLVNAGAKYLPLDEVLARYPR